MNANPKFWTPQKLTEEELEKICTWLWRWQAACVSGDSLAQDFLEEGDLLPSQRLDPTFVAAMGHIQALVRHIGAISE